jgi:hypothetical protein
MARYYEALTHNQQKKQPDNTSNDKVSDYSKLAEQEYKIAIAHQPSWDYAWAKLANLYSNQLELNKTNFMLSISKAMLLGPYEKQTQIVIIPLIFKHWSILFNNNQTHDEIIRIIKHTLKHNNLAVFTIDSAKKYQRLKELAPLLTKQWHKNKLLRYLKEAANE